jgi:hypothetical protein
MRRPKVWMLLLIIAFVAVTLGMAVNRYRAEQLIITRLRRLGADIQSEPGLLGQWWPKIVGAEAHGHGFTDEGMALLANLTDLQGVSLIGTPTTDDGLAHLVNLRGLDIIYLEDTQITDAGLKHLAGMKSLTEIRIAGGRITEDGLAGLRRAMPKLKVVEGYFL